ncbi:UvrD-helicase domain-containing protein [bacterium]|nr:UvrD-helicase domain-containing protein [bacterium]NIN93207.1 UvrD-helicase domain-containing protein [bacterium]NIO19004.1 UvrD-helicase domain-containing protein [bacterium]NIO74133.1 UvrD-helicase domain-containing protein [bacterium]
MEKRTKGYNILDDLNPSQREAVEHIQGPLLILAGAGSGKTRVITYRIAYLIEKHISPWNILAVTFTNKAAGEMRGRVDRLVGGKGRSVWISTFHSFAARLLREEIDKIGGSRHFVIYDEMDQLNLIKECTKELDIDEKRFKIAVAQALINRAKDNLVDVESFSIYAQASGDYYRKVIADIYQLYQRKLKESSALDFADLLMEAVRLFKQRKEILEKYQERFRYIMVDEYQDTNHAQYLLTKLLASKHKNICVVGDDDQSIYSFRGADLRNILHFERDYKDVKVMKLEQNYRSTKNILDMAWKVVKNNRYRKKKKLWTNREEGMPVEYALVNSEIDEANLVVEEVIRLMEERHILKDFAVFYRTNAQSRVLEDALRKAKINYAIVGGVRFYERKEIKDILAYLRVIVNPLDSLNLKRILNVPRRGIGKKTLNYLEQYASRHQKALFETLTKIREIKAVPGHSSSRVEGFMDLIGQLREKSRNITAKELTRMVIETTGYLSELASEDTIEAESRIENVKELVSAVGEFEEQSEDKTIEAFLEQVSLITDIDTWDEENDRVTLMTLHLAKGLEFPVVFVTGLEEGLFPHSDALYDEAEMEEERRLCYVGMTRAKERLYMTSASQRRLYGQWRWNTPSRFVVEAGLLGEKVGLWGGEISPDEAKGKDVRASLFSQVQVDEWQVGARVKHEEFGLGRILERTGSGKDTKIVVLFENGQWRKFLVKYARIKKI